jgi:hypothetical protein
LYFSSSLFASEFILEDINNTKDKSSYIVLPYLFSSDSMGLTVGAVGIFHGYFQPQMTMLLTAYAGEKLEVENITQSQSVQKDEARASGFAFSISGYKPWFSQRMFITILGSYAYYPNQRIYLNSSNDSKQNLDSLSFTPLQTQGYNNWVKADFRYVLPFGESKKNILPVIKLDRGIAVNRDNMGGTKPFVTGQTILGVELFYTKWTADKFLQEPSLNTNGIRVYLNHNNTDYPDNPTRGYDFEVKTSIDFGTFNSTQSWNSIEASYSQYIEMPLFSWSRQNVVALNAWSAYSPSWDKSQKLNPDSLTPILDKNQPPMYEGARLGGWIRMRGYDSNRFNDKSAMYMAAEYRVIPEFNPLRAKNWMPINIDWFQTVVFAEMGRVAPSYNLRTLFSDMKYDVGFSIRALAAKLPVRFDMAFGEEGSNMWVMVQQPF